ncbi:MAG TPA: hypothetical protein VIV09_14640 [Pseudolabrys sp.]
MNYTIKHWGRGYNPAEEGICSEPGCMEPGADFQDGKVKCSGHLQLRLEVRRGIRETRLPAVR